MKKKNAKSLLLNRQKISSLKPIKIMGGGKTWGCTHTLESICKTSICYSNDGNECNFTELNCQTEPTYCSGS